MHKPFFQQYGNGICFQDGTDLVSKLSKIDCSVPGRDEGRKSYHREKYSLNHYLLALSGNNLLEFPMFITKCESPDFILKDSTGDTVGLEHTDATTETHQRAMTGLARSPEGSFLEGDRVVKAGDGLVGGSGWSGDSVEREWVRIVLNAIEKKTKKLNQQHFKTANRYELLIYDNTRQRTVLYIKDALSLLKEAINKDLNLKSFKRNFHCISVITHSDQLLLYDVANKGRVLRIKRERDSEIQSDI